MSRTMDELIIERLSVSTHIGVHAWEQKIKQQLLLDISIPSDFSHGIDDLSHTLDYDALCKAVTVFVENNSFQLIEYVAHQVALLIKEQFNVGQLTVAVNKPHAVANAGAIKVRVTR